jgi:hypothetical protein
MGMKYRLTHHPPQMKWTPLLCAVMAQPIVMGGDMVNIAGLDITTKLLIDAGADVTRRDKNVSGCPRLACCVLIDYHVLDLLPCPQLLDCYRCVCAETSDDATFDCHGLFVDVRRV